MNLAELAEKIGGVLEGDGETEITGVAGIQDAGPGDVSFVDNPKYAKFAYQCAASPVPEVCHTA